MRVRDPHSCIGIAELRSKSSDASIRGLFLLVIGSAKLLFPEVQNMRETTRVSNLKRMTLISARTDLSMAFQNKERVSNKSCESKKTTASISIPSTMLNAPRSIFASSIPSSTAKISVAPVDFTGLHDLRELYEMTWNVEPSSSSQKIIPEMQPSCP